MRYFLNFKVRNFIMRVLTKTEYEKFHHYKSSKELSLDKTYDNYDHITKILQSVPRQWRSQVTSLRASKDLKASHGRTSWHPQCS
ncbi:hypothetical protein CR513_39442, partial [Mucuna pruriens]